MSEPVKPAPPRRSYRSPLRAEQARQTRLRIIAAARELFLERGYPATTVEAVGERAGVAADTVYHVFRSKRGLLSQVMNVEVGGDDADVRLLDRDEPQAMRREPDQRRQVAMFAAGLTGQLERVRPLDDILRSAAAVDEGAAGLRSDLQLRQRREAMTTVAGWLAESGPLRPGTTVERAAAVLWTLTSPEVHHMLREVWGWTPDDYQNWLRETLTRTLLPD